MSLAAVFLDRDGTLIEDRGNLAHPDQVVFYPFTVGALRRLGERFTLFIVTNQNGVGEGAITLEQAAGVNEFVVHHLAAAGIAIREVFCCPHLRSAGCNCHKPLPHFAHAARERHGVDLSRSFMIGDHPSDVLFGVNMGGRGVHVMTGHGARHREQVPGPSESVADLGAAVDWILRTT